MFFGYGALAVGRRFDLSYPDIDTVEERDMSEFWFKPKTHGYGAYPTGWKGWALILGVFLANIALLAILFAPPLLAGEVPGIARFVLFALVDTALVVGFLILVRNKTDGAWRWRWGKG